MSACLRTLRSMSTQVPRPKNWRTSRSNAPNPLSAPRTPVPSPPLHQLRHQASREPTSQQHAAHRLALKKAFPNGWSPPRRVSRDAMDSLRMLHSHSPDTFTTPVLAERFKISPEAVRRILKSKWEPDNERKAEIRMRDENKKAEWRKQRVRKEWNEGVDKGALKIRERLQVREDELELV